MTIKRIPSNAQGRCDATAFNGMAFVVAYDADAAKSIEAQTRNTLHFLDVKLSEVGSGKHALLQATVFLSDMSMKPAMDKVWCEWIGSEENWPQKGVCWRRPG
ncbi:MAG: Rid family hydrolase [Paracoccaceae bacterium]